MNLEIKYTIDTNRFDTEAAAWVNGTFEFSYHFWYTGYIALLALCKLLFHSIYPSIGIQCSISLVSILLFYKGLFRILKDEFVAFVAALLVILYLPIYQWNYCLLTESFYISSILLTVWTYSLENKQHKWIGLFIVTTIATILRPNGGILLLAILLLSAKEYSTIQNRKYMYTLGIFIILALLLLLNNTTSIFYKFLVDSFNKGEVICGYSGWTVPTTSHIEPDDSNGSIIKIGKLLFAHPAQSIQLAIYRFFALYTDVRLYYSNFHNAFISIFLLFSYLSAGIGIFHDRKKYRGLFLITVCYIGLNSLLVMITYADWDGRFLAPLLPIVFIWSALGMHYLYEKLSTIQTNNQ